MSARDKPVIFVVDDDPTMLGHVSGELERRYDRDYRIVFEGSSRDALARLESMRESGDRVAIVLADQWMPGLAGAELLSRVKELHPHAKRAMLLAWGDWGDQPTADAVRGAMSTGCIDYYVLKPWKSPDELFHRSVSEFLHEWARADVSAPFEVTVIAERRSARGHELRNLLARNGVPHVFHAADSEQGTALLREMDREGAEAPIVRLLGGTVLVDPTDAELASAYGVSTELEGSCEFDVVVVGAGPAGLAAAVYASSEGLDAMVVEREAIGGQAGSSSMIRNYLGFSRGVSGGELAQRAYQQAWIFGTKFLLMRRISTLRCGDDIHVLTVADGPELCARAVVLAMGVNYRRLEIEALERLVGSGVFYGAAPSEARQLAGGNVYVVGGGNSAGQAALNLGRYAERVTILVRGPTLAKSMSRYLIDTIDSAGNITALPETHVVDGSGDGRLERLILRDGDGAERSVEADALFVLIGATPHTDWLPPEIARDAHGFLVTGAELSHDGLLGDWPMARAPYAYETTVPGVFAVGDVRSRSVKRVASAVGEGSAVVQVIHQHLESQSRTVHRGR